MVELDRSEINERIHTEEQSSTMRDSVQDSANSLSEPITVENGSSVNESVNEPTVSKPAVNDIACSIYNIDKLPSYDEPVNEPITKPAVNDLTYSICNIDKLPNNDEPTVQPSTVQPATDLPPLTATFVGGNKQATLSTSPQPTNIPDLTQSFAVGPISHNESSSQENDIDDDLKVDYIPSHNNTSPDNKTPPPQPADIHKSMVDINEIEAPPMYPVPKKDKSHSYPSPIKPSPSPVQPSPSPVQPSPIQPSPSPNPSTLPPPPSIPQSPASDYFSLAQSKVITANPPKQSTLPTVSVTSTTPTVPVTSITSTTPTVPTTPQLPSSPYDTNHIIFSSVAHTTIQPNATMQSTPPTVPNTPTQNEVNVKYAQQYIDTVIYDLQRLCVCYLNLIIIIRRTRVKNI